MKKRIPAVLFLLVFLLGLSGCISFRPLTQSSVTDTAPGTNEGPSVPASVTDEPTDPVTEDITDTPVTDAPEPLEELRVSFLGAGDNIIYYGNVRDAASCAVSGRTYNFAPMYERLAERIAGADIAFINQETLMSGGAFSYYPLFNGPQDLGFDLAEVGFDIVNIANNHMLDKGADGLSSTIDFWRTIESVTLIGGYKNEQEYNDPCVLEKNGLRIAFLSYTCMTNGLSLPAGSSLIVPLPEEDVVRTQLARAREAADFVIVSVHWGDENVFTPNEEQKTLASLFAENGADVILGHHPHVLQPVEWIDRADGGRTLCVYSLGNFAAEMAYDYNMLGGMISFDIVRHETGEITAEDVVFLPTVYYFTSTFYQNRIYLLEDFTEQLAASHGVVGYYGHAMTLARLNRYLKQTIREEFLPESLR